MTKEQEIVTLLESLSLGFSSLLVLFLSILALVLSFFAKRRRAAKKCAYAALGVLGLQVLAWICFIVAASSSRRGAAWDHGWLLLIPGIFTALALVRAAKLKNV